MNSATAILLDSNPEPVMLTNDWSLLATPRSLFRNALPLTKTLLISPAERPLSTAFAISDSEQTTSDDDTSRPSPPVLSVRSPSMSAYEKSRSIPSEWAPVISTPRIRAEDPIRFKASSLFASLKLTLSGSASALYMAMPPLSRMPPILVLGHEP